MSNKELGWTERRVINWAEDRGIFARSSTQSQMLKTMEEVGELAETVLKEDKDNFELECGDVLVTLALQCQMQGTDLNTCFARAYEKISTRTGEMKGGVFVKAG